MASSIRAMTYIIRYTYNQGWVQVQLYLITSVIKYNFLSLILVLEYLLCVFFVLVIVFKYFDNAR